MDGMPDVKTLRRMCHAARRCTGCGKPYQKQPPKCPNCGSQEFEPISLRAPEYCEVFGHNDTETPVPGSERAANEQGETVGGIRRSIVYISRKYLVCCRRCGRQTTERKTDPKPKVHDTKIRVVAPKRLR